MAHSSNKTNFIKTLTLKATETRTIVTDLGRSVYVVESETDHTKVTINLEDKKYKYLAIKFKKWNMTRN